MTPRDDATEQQVRASDPRKSTWLSANAGSGKTRVLTDRVARLLFDAVDPQNILCLTYTKAAASEMQNRLFQRLGAWAMMSAAKLTEQLRTLGVEDDLSNDDLKRARTLFARAIETPGGLRIQTIHSFCAGLLRRFPLEAGVSPQFSEMEDRTAVLLRNEVVDKISEELPLIVQGLARHMSGDDLDPLLKAIAAKKRAFAVRPDINALYDLFGVPSGLTIETLLSNTLTDLDRKNLGAFITLCETGSTTDLKTAAKLRLIPRTGALNAQHLEQLEDVFVFGPKTKHPLCAKIGTVPTKPLQKKAPELVEEIDDLMVRLQEARPLRLGLAAIARTQALYAFATEFVHRYEAAKLARGLLDFDDLIDRARGLLNDPTVAQWVLFRLDGGIDHILVDEAQDTSPSQWSVIESLAQEFSAGQGALPDRRRTIFVVGDKKQSIYSFQGADPEGFDRMRDHFEQALGNVQERLEKLDLQYSFRSASAVLRTVDTTFVDDLLDGLGPDAPEHFAFRETLPGRVDLWPPLEKIKEDEAPSDWTAPVDAIGTRHEKVRLAEAIAAEIKRMIETETIHAQPVPNGPMQRRPITAGDVLILVQRRSDLFAEIIRACKQAGLDVAGADRLRVGAELAVKDIEALLKFLALPEDDLSLAAALRSPIFGWSEKALFDLAQPRGRAFLWQALREAEGHDDTKAVLFDLLARADFMRPYDLINRILTRHDGRRRLLARLGPEAEDGIDALLSQALGYERSNIPGLTGFLEWLGEDDLEIKRQADGSSGKIRVMTVHGAKGLEAPIVFLPDSGKRQNTVKDPLLPSGDMVMWAGNVGSMPQVMTDAREDRKAANERERRRLLYVAMTRAQSWLVVCAAGDTGSGGESWHAMVQDGMARAGAVAHEFGVGPGLRVSNDDWDAGNTVQQTNDAPVQVSMPAHLGPIGDRIDRSKPLLPSDLGGDKVLPGEADYDVDLDPKERGTLVHRLLEHLPRAAPQDRARLGAQLAPHNPELVADALALIDAPHLADIFGSDALTEVDVTAKIHAPAVRLHGAIDRLIIEGDRILAVDYKTNRVVPNRPEDTPEGLLRQMGAYHAMLTEIWPGRTIDVAILWTAEARLMPMPQALVTTALARATLP